MKLLGDIISNNSKKELLWGIIPPALFLIALAIVYFGGFDDTLFFAINSLSPVTGEILWENITILGDGLVIAAFLFPFIRKNPQLVWAGLLAIIFATIFTHSLKANIDAYRPLKALGEEAVNLVGPAYHHNSFPSGHTTVAFAVIGVFALFAKNNAAKVFLLISAAIIGMSRIVVGIHFPVDVLAGACGGWLAAWISCNLSARWKWGYTGIGFKLLALLSLASVITLLIMNHTKYDNAIYLHKTIAVVTLVIGSIELYKVFKPTGRKLA